jgi:hypothetical protein
MRILRLLIAAGAVTAMLVAPVSAAPATPGDSVSGVGIRLSAFRVQYTVSVKGGPGAPIGSFLFRGVDFPLTFGGRATCFDIAGNEAAIGGVITHSTNSELLGAAYLVFFEDNGFPATPGQAGPDVVSQTYILPADAGNVDVPDGFPAVCPDAAATAHDAFDVQGNFVVRDL